MSKFCSNCGKEINEKDNFCLYCGTPTNINYNQNTNNDNVQQSNSAYINNYIPNIRKRDVAKMVILSFVTCGIYSIYWFICLTDETNIISYNERTQDGTVSFILGLVTCSIYLAYSNYKIGKKLYEAGRINNIDINDNSILYLVL